MDEGVLRTPPSAGRVGRLAAVDQLGNTSDEPARVLFVSGFALPRAAVQPDSGKLMIRWGPGWDESLWFRRADAADYWDGEDT